MPDGLGRAGRRVVRARISYAEAKSSNLAAVSGCSDVNCCCQRDWDRRSPSISATTSSTSPFFAAVAFSAWYGGLAAFAGLLSYAIANW